MDIKINWNICRICLQVETKGIDGTEHMRNIFNGDTKLVQHIYDCSGIKVRNIIFWNGHSESYVLRI